MLVEQLFYATVVGSPYQGALAIHASFGKNGVEYDPVSFVDKVVNYPQSAAFPAILLTGDFSVLQSENVTSVVKALLDWNYSFIIESDGTTYPTWFTLPILAGKGWIVATINKDPWLMFECNELRLIYSDEGTPEPAVPRKGPQRFTLVPTNEDLVESAVKLISKSERPWTILPPNLKHFYRKDL